MSTAELMQEIDKLPHAEKFQLAHFLLARLAEEDGVALPSQPNTESPRPVGRVYHSGRRDVSSNAHDLAFSDRLVEVRGRSCK